MPVINYPEAAILGMGSLKPRPVVVDDTVVARPTMTLTCVFDHRIADGAQVAGFLGELRELIEAPELALLDCSDHRRRAAANRRANSGDKIDAACGPSSVSTAIRVLIGVEETRIGGGPHGGLGRNDHVARRGRRAGGELSRAPRPGRRRP